MTQSSFSRGRQMNCGHETERTCISILSYVCKYSALHLLRIKYLRIADLLKSVIYLVDAVETVCFHNCTNSAVHLHGLDKNVLLRS